MTSVPRIQLSDDDGDWHELEAALSVAHAALTDARALAERLDGPQPLDATPGLRLTDALDIIVRILDAYTDPPVETNR